MKLFCPKDGDSLDRQGEALVCARGHSFPIVDEIPVLLRDDIEHTIDLATASLNCAKHPEEGPLYLESVGISDAQKRLARRAFHAQAEGVDPVAAVLVGATSGNAYRHLIGRLSDYPIPSIGLPPSPGDSLIDLGCSWGRWSFAAAKMGYRVTGVDPSLGALLAARRISKTLGLEVQFVCADARYLPFTAGSFDVAYSYSVLQHFSSADAGKALDDLARVLKTGGTSFVQMAHHGGPASLYHQVRRGFRPTTGFQVRYWRLEALREEFSARIGPSVISPHCFFGLGLEPGDRHLYRPLARALSSMSESLVSVSRRFRPLIHVSDSVFVSSTKTGPR